MTEGVDETIRALQAQDADILVVACQGREDDRSLQIIDGAHRARLTLPIIVLSAASPNGFLRRAFEVGAADMAMFPQTKEQLRFAMSKAIARRPGLGAARRRAARGSADLRARAEGRHRQDAHLLQPRDDARARRVRRCSSSTSTSSSATSRSDARPSAREDDVRPRGLGRLARRGQARRLRHDPHDGRRHPPRAPLGPTRRARSRSSSSATSSSSRATTTTTSSPTRLRASPPR